MTQKERKKAKEERERERLARDRESETRREREREGKKQKKKRRLNEETEVNESDQSDGMEKMNWNSSEIYMLLGKSCRSEMGKWGGQLLKGAVTRVSV